MRLFLSTTNWIPEEIILAVLSDFKGQKPSEVIKNILVKLMEISSEEITLRKYITQLSVLARLRNLTKDTHKQIKTMGLTYNITEDYLYQEGVVKGIEKEKKEMIIRMLADKTLSADKIAQFAGVSVEHVKALALEMKNQNQ